MSYFVEQYPNFQLGDKLNLEEDEDEEGGEEV